MAEDAVSHSNQDVRPRTTQPAGTPAATAPKSGSRGRLGWGQRDGRAGGGAEQARPTGASAAMMVVLMGEVKKGARSGLRAGITHTRHIGADAAVQST